MDKLHVGQIGFGQRGSGLLEGVLLRMADVEVVAVCDKYEDRRQNAAEKILQKRGNKAKVFENYEDLLALKEVDVVVDTSSWDGHNDVPVKAMKAGKPVAFEVGGAYSLQHCWDLVRTYQETKVPCMMLENCCYARNEMMILNMVKQGLFGEIVHCQGGYRHDLRNEIARGEEIRHYRLRNYSNRNCDNYPTHQLGPIAKILDINRGNRMISLTSTASKSVGLNEFVKNKMGADHPLVNRRFVQGDVVTTVIKCAHGETITLTLDTSLPRCYSRGYEVHGTKGMFQEDNMSIYLESMTDVNHESHATPIWNNIEKFREEYDHPLWKRTLSTTGTVGGHGGMDGFVFRAFLESVKNGTPTPIDVYDAAAWISITALSEESITLGSMPVAIPDFTEGKWLEREPAHEWRYSLDHICDEDRNIFDLYEE